MEVVKMRIINLENLLARYFEFKEDEEGFQNFLAKKAQELNKDRTSDSVSGDKREEISKSK